jgi:Galactose oxidase, central domain/Kelch motif
MTTQRELEGILDAFFADGADELADRVIYAALDQIDHTPQRRAMHLLRIFPTMDMLTRLAAAAIIGVLVVGAALYLTRPNQLVVGGPTPNPCTSASGSEPAPTPSVRLAASMGTGRQIHTATRLADGRVLIAGGYTLVDVAVASAELYDPATNAFSPTGSLGAARGLHTATLLADCRVLIAGGGPATWATRLGAFVASAELYDPTTGTFSPTGSMTTAREGQTATLLKDFRVLIAGGNDRVEHAVASAELYDPTTGAFTTTGSMAAARGFHTATLLSDGRVLITGGDPAAWVAPGPFIASAEIYDPTTGKFSATGSMTVGRELHAATLLTDGRVLITGGVTNPNPALSLASAEIYDPTAGTFSRTGPMTVARVYQTSTLLADGRVLIAGGCARGRGYADNPQFLASAELYDPTSGTFTATGPMTERRTWQMATSLADGRVLMTGGYGDQAPLATAEIFDPTTGTFSPAGSGR